MILVGIAHAMSSNMCMFRFISIFVIELNVFWAESKFINKSTVLSGVKVDKVGKVLSSEIFFSL